MRLRLRRRGERDAQAQLPGVAAATDQDLVVSAGASWLSRAAIIGCLAAGPLAMAAVVLAPFGSRAVAPAAVAADPSASVRVQAGEYGLRVVAAWLGSTRNEDQVSELIGGAGQLMLGASPVPVKDLQVAAVQPAGDQVWSVTVAGTLAALPESDSPSTEQDPAGSARRYFQVPVVVASSGALTSLGIPAVVPGPGLVSDRVTLDYPTAVPTSSVLGKTSSEFLNALLAGVGDVGRYVSPGTTLTPGAPMFTAVKVSSVVAAKDSSAFDPTQAPADGQQVRVIVSAVGSISADQVLPIGYALTFTGRAGRWEVTTVDPAPKWRVTASSVDDASGADASAEPKEN